MRSLLLSAALLLSVCAFSQDNYIALHVGPTLSKSVNNYSEFIPGVQVGAMSSAELSYPLYFKTGFSYSTGGYIQDDIDYRLNYYNLPFQFKYYFTDSFNAALGGQVNLLKKAYLKSGDSEINIKDLVNGFGAGLRGSVGYEIDNFILELDYYHGLTDIYKEDSSTKNISFQFSLAYKIIKENSLK